MVSIKARGVFLLSACALALGVAPADARPKAPKSADEILVGAERRRFDVLGLIMEDADHATDKEERARLLGEYFDTSDLFLREHPDSITVWTARALVTIELNRPIAGWTAGQALIRLGAETMDDLKIRRALAMLDRRGWLDEVAPKVGPKDGEPWQNSLGMRFVPVEGTDVLFCIWETRVRDFSAFVDASGYDATSGMLSFEATEATWKRQGASWRMPGFDQSAEHPVVGVNWYDANAFCAWLTLKERRAGLIAGDQEYRLPYDAEWSAAVGPGTYAWGEQWPPPADAGNFLGEENLPTPLRVLEGYNDNAPRTAGVGQFTRNRFGLYDLAGNVEEWCEDFFRSGGGVTTGESKPVDEERAQKYRILRGASWSYQNATNLNVQQRHRAEPDHRIDDVGFRCVFVTGVKPPEPGVVPPATGFAADSTPISAGHLAPAPGTGDPAIELSRPRPIHQVEPEYPYERKVLNDSGIVVLEFNIDETGTVQNPRVVSSTHPAFEAPALTAVRDWRFEPARRGGQPVMCHVMQEFRFNVKPLDAFAIP
jgi:TonB family protein